MTATNILGTASACVAADRADHRAGSEPGPAGEPLVAHDLRHRTGRLAPHGRLRHVERRPDADVDPALATLRRSRLHRYRGCHRHDLRPRCGRRRAALAGGGEGDERRGSVEAPSAQTAPVAAATGDPTIATAGDIACDPLNGNFNGGAGTGTVCAQRAVSNLMFNRGFRVGAAARRQPVLLRRPLRLPAILRPQLGPPALHHPPGGRQPRVRDDRRYGLRHQRQCRRVFQLFRRARRLARAGVLQLRRRHVAPHRPELQLRQRRWLRPDQSSGQLAGCGSRGPSKRLHAGLLAHPAVQFRRSRSHATPSHCGPPSTTPVPT